jgi:hypothetical protein
MVSPDLARNAYKKDARESSRASFFIRELTFPELQKSDREE